MTEEWHKEVDRLNGLEEKSCEDICQTQCQGLCGAEEEEKK